MGRSKQADAQTACAVNALQHGARGTFAIRAGDVNEAKLMVWIAGQLSELERILQSELRAEQAQAVERLDGFRVIHLSVAWQMPEIFANRRETFRSAWFFLILWTIP